MAHANPGAHLIGQPIKAAYANVRDDKDVTSSPKDRKEDNNTSDDDASSLDRAEKWLEQLYNYPLWHPRFTRVFILILGLGLILTIGGFGLKQFVKAPPVEPLYTKVEGIKQLGKLKLVRHLYESVIPITKNKLDRHEAIKKQKLQFLLTAPVEIYGFVDLGKVQVDIKARDSLVMLTVPQAQHSPPYLDLANTQEFLIQRKHRFFGSYLEFTNHIKAYKDIVSGLNESKQQVIDRAIANGLLSDTEEKAAIFLRGFVRNLGYKRVDVRFVPDSMDYSQAASDASLSPRRVKQTIKDIVQGN